MLLADVIKFELDLFMNQIIYLLSHKGYLIIANLLQLEFQLVVFHTLVLKYLFKLLYSLNMLRLTILISTSLLGLAESGCIEGALSLMLQYHSTPTIVEVRVFILELTLWRFLATWISNEIFELAYSQLFDLYELFCFFMNAIIGIELFLKLDDCLISFV